jgi:L-ascorbate metabolism protein UlaG (beta-lactamase superfamily)
MKITKYLHSCLLVEENDQVVLIDPGAYTYDANVLDLNLLKKLDFILITHEHADHFSLPFVQEITRHFPEVSIITTKSVAQQLEKELIPVMTEGTYDLHLEPVPHEDILFAPPPENMKFTLFNKLSHPGDSFHFTSGTDILAMPMTAPWGSMVDAMKKVIDLKPKIVIPIHDWHWKDEAIESFYPRIADLFNQHGIEFKLIKTGETIQI